MDTVYKLKPKFDIGKLKQEVDSVLEDHKLHKTFQLCLTHRSIATDVDPWYDGCGSAVIYEDLVNQIVKQDTDGNDVKRFEETDFDTINPGLEGTEIEKVFKTFKEQYKVGRFRIASLPPKRCYTWHSDYEKRIHVPIHTYPGCFLITEQDQKFRHLPDSGETWMFEANAGYHTAINADAERNRVHLLLCITD